MERTDLRAGAEAAWRLVSAANQFIVSTAPWTLAKQEQTAKLDAVLAALARCLTRLAILIEPFMPGKAAELWRHLGQDAPLTGAWPQATAPEVLGRRVHKPDGLFPKPVPSSP
jgi:methionyl-tRNA synthetase